jgi:hypothetical protein
MPARRVTGDEEAWGRVADAVAARRLALAPGGLRAAELVERANGAISLSLLSLIENARQTSYLQSKLASLSLALGWTHDSIERILAGGEPAEAAHTAAADLTPATHAEVSAMRAEIAELRRLLEERTAQRS